MDRTGWWLAFVIVVAASIAVIAYTVPVVAIPEQGEAIRASVLESGATAEQADAALQMAGKFAFIGVGIAVVFSAVTLFGILFAVAGIIHGLSLGFGGRGKFRISRAVVAWSLVVTALGSLVKVPIMVARRTMFVETGPTLFFRELERTDWRYSLLNSFDVFTLWWILLLGVGVAVGYRLPGRKAAWIALIMLAIVVVVTTAVGVAQSFFAGLAGGGAFGGPR